MCPRALWLEQGTVKMDGPAQEVVGCYQSADLPVIQAAGARHG
jgi:ABC-type polysaccharide/polyol phosphate transport system ATPase subunit